MHQVILAISIATIASCAFASEPIITPGDGGVPPGIYSMVPHKKPRPSQSKDLAAAMLQINCTSPTVFDTNGVALSLISTTGRKGRIASIQRVQSCTVEDGLLACRPAKRNDLGEAVVKENAAATLWRLSQSEDARTLLCGPSEGSPPKQNAACYSLNACPAQTGEIVMQGREGGTIGDLVNAD